MGPPVDAGFVQVSQPVQILPGKERKRHGQGSARKAKRLPGHGVRLPGPQMDGNGCPHDFAQWPGQAAPVQHLRR